MARALVEQQGPADYAALSFEERLGLRIDRETRTVTTGASSGT
jgi:hypothetical protein